MSPTPPFSVSYNTYCYSYIQEYIHNTGTYLRTFFRTHLNPYVHWYAFLHSRMIIITLLATIAYLCQTSTSMFFYRALLYTVEIIQLCARCFILKHSILLTPYHITTPAQPSTGRKAYRTVIARESKRRAWLPQALPTSI